MSNFAGFTDGPQRDDDLMLISPNQMELAQTAKRLVEERHATPG